MQSLVQQYHNRLGRSIESPQSFCATCPCSSSPHSYIYCLSRYLQYTYRAWPTCVANNIIVSIVIALLHCYRAGRCRCYSTIAWTAANGQASKSTNSQCTVVLVHTIGPCRSLGSRWWRFRECHGLAIRRGISFFGPLKRRRCFF